VNGHEVTVVRAKPLSEVHGTLHRLGPDGAMIFVPSRETIGAGELRFLPTHTIVEVIDRGERPR
jgi:hypothetical protein